MVFDMFGSDSDTESASSKAGTGSKRKAENFEYGVKRHRLDVDDSEGYYVSKIDECMNERYVILGNIGRGVFSSVVVAKDKQSDENIAVKVVRSNKLMENAALKEVKILRKLEKVPHVIQLLDEFKHRNHMCLVFEQMKMNLRELLHQYGKKSGLSFQSVVIYTKQIFTSLFFLKKRNIVHADLKLDNILVSEKLGMVKLCDFGSGFEVDDPSVSERDHAPYLVSRYYRAPETILGLKNSFPIDVWSLATCVFELLSGQIMFKGDSNNEMLCLFQEAKGRFPNRLIKKHIKAYLIIHRELHFDPTSYKFRKLSENRVDLISLGEKPTKSVGRMINQLNLKSDEPQQIKDLASLLESSTSIDPLKRITPEAALKSPLFVKK